MKEELAMKWADALESGEYKQSQHQLRDANGFCCLGVLCNLHALEHPEIAAAQDSIFEYMGSEGGLPDAVQNWANMNGNEGEFTGGVIVNNAVTLAQLNDGCAGVPSLNRGPTKPHTFKQIAKIIRKHYKDL